MSSKAVESTAMLNNAQQPTQRPATQQPKVQPAKKPTTTPIKK